MKTLIDWLIGWPDRVSQHLGSLAPLFARIVVGWVFLWSGWGKLSVITTAGVCSAILDG
jgi:putative oxidoreductase